MFEQGTLVVVTTIGVCLGHYTRSGSEGAFHFTSPELISSIVVALAVIPSIIREESFLDPKTPFINRVGLSLQKGLASDAIVQGIGIQLP